MDVENIRNNGYKLINHLESKGYSNVYIAMYKKVIEAILAEPKDGNWNDYNSFYEWFALGRYPSMRRKYKGVVAAIEAFDLREKYPDGERLIRPKRFVLCDEFRELPEYYKARETENGRLKLNTIERNENGGRSFLYTLQSVGITKLGSITEEAILSAFTGTDGKLIKGATYFHAARQMFLMCADKYPTARILPLVPGAVGTIRRRKTIEYLTPEETAKIRAVLESDSAGLNLRDKAIGIIAYYTGLRRSDIAGLNLDSIDIVNDRIRIIQQKTGEPLELPLRPIVGNAIYDYVRLERPRSSDPALFLIKHKRRMRSQSLWGISNKILQVAGVRQGAGHHRKGLHIFRHHLATKLLENEIPQPMISGSLGHANPMSLEAYVASDFVHLKTCALSVECFPVAAGVLQ